MSDGREICTQFQNSIIFTICAGTNEIGSFIQIVLFTRVRSFVFARTFTPMAVSIALDLDENATHRFVAGQIQKHAALQQCSTVAHLLRIIVECNSTCGWHSIGFFSMSGRTVANTGEIKTERGLKSENKNCWRLQHSEKWRPPQKQRSEEMNSKRSKNDVTHAYDTTRRTHTQTQLAAKGIPLGIQLRTGRHKTKRSRTNEKRRKKEEKRTK